MEPRSDSRDAWNKALSDLNVWKRGDTRAPHKPLLLLLLIARAQRGDSRLVPFTDIDKSLVALLREFGPQRKSYHSEFPFWHLQGDGFWTVLRADELPRRKGKYSPSKKMLVEADARGAISEPLWDALVTDPGLRRDLATQLLAEFWPQTLHQEILSAVGLSDADDETSSSASRRRDPAFRVAVLRAYERRCAVCRYDGRLGDATLGLDAAHVRWHAERGPDIVQNGLALCTFHHVAFDRGAIGVSPDRRVLISADVVGGSQAQSLLVGYSGTPLLTPQTNAYGPAAEFIAWHRSEVFREPARQI